MSVEEIKESWQSKSTWVHLKMYTKKYRSGVKQINRRVPFLAVNFSSLSHEVSRPRKVNVSNVNFTTGNILSVKCVLQIGTTLYHPIRN